jgi:aminoglycoside phosphotransferase (APT) family kinase protein
VPVRPPDEIELKIRLARHLDQGEKVESLHRLPGGLSGITYVASCRTATRRRRIIVKVAPTGVMPTGNRDVLRQADVQLLLADVGSVPVPGVLFRDAGDPPETPPFYGTEFVDGVSSEPLDEECSPVPEAGVLRARYLEIARTLGRFHRTPLDNSLFIEEKHGDAASELSKWQRAFSSVPDELRVNADECAVRLSDSAPESRTPTLVHGDYRLGNTICVADRIVAVIDWELYGIGDPRCDLGWLLHMSDPSAQTARRHLAGVPSREDMIQAYVDTSGAAVPNLKWFEALALFKRAAATALIVKHNRRSQVPDPVKEKAAEVIQPLLAASATTLTEHE